MSHQSLRKRRSQKRYPEATAKLRPDGVTGLLRSLCAAVVSAKERHGSHSSTYNSCTYKLRRVIVFHLLTSHSHRIRIEPSYVRLEKGKTLEPLLAGVCAALEGGIRASAQNTHGLAASRKRPSKEGTACRFSVAARNDGDLDVQTQQARVKAA